MGRVSRIVPKDWTKYEPLGEVIPKTRFIVFKTPICDDLATKIPRDKHFNAADLIRKLAMQGKHLGIVLDLTDTDRYYDKRDITAAFVKHKKINCPGRGFIDRDECVEEFFKAVNDFSEKSDDEEALIGVHSTHGINRSGYMICRYLIERQGWSSHEALDAFERARGYPIEKGSYVQALHKAAVDARKRVDTDSDSSDRKKRKKNKRKHREDIESELIISSLVNELGQQNQNQSNYSSPVDHSPQQPHWQSVVKKSKYQRLDEAVHQQTASATDSPQIQQTEGELEEGVDDGEEYEEDLDETAGSGVGGQVDVVHQTTASKRRARRARKQKLFEVMKRGNFHEIQAMQAEFVNQYGRQE